MGFLDLDADTSNLPERVPQGYFRKERPPDGFLARMWWHAKRRPLILTAVLLFPVAVLGTFFLVTSMNVAQSKPTPVDQIKVTEGDAKSTETIQINIKDKNPSEDPEYRPPRKPVVPLPSAAGRPTDPGKSD